MTQSEDDVYGSGLNRADWYALRGQVDPYYSSRDGKFIPPDEIDAPSVPDHLTNHIVARLVRKYRATGERKYLDRAGKTLVPGCKLWWLVISKS
jgi:hypothetical protein